MSGKISLDTNVVIRFFKNDPAIITKLLDFRIICLPVPVVAELFFGAENSKRSKDNLKMCNEFVDQCVIQNITRKTAEFYSNIRLSLKKQGTPIPENDLWIASLCMENEVTLMTNDEHFGYVKKLPLILIQ